jgi:pimeloyl-ACP methyl ester carboxylesterase
MKLSGLPEFTEERKRVDPIRSDDLLKRAKFSFPVYAFGYNWLASNGDAAAQLKTRIEKVISDNNSGGIRCRQVILVTHSMGGLVARACSLLPGMSTKVLGVVHGVMPALGAPVAYRRCKVGMEDEDRKAAMVIGDDGPKVAAVFAQAPGALQLLPAQDYGPHWLHIKDAAGATVASLPNSDSYEEIYLQRDKWWGLVREEWLSPDGGKPFSWGKYVANIKRAREFHRDISGKYHPNTYVFYGGGKGATSFAKVQWLLEQGSQRAGPRHLSPAAVVSLNYEGISTDGGNGLYAGAFEAAETMLRGDAPRQFRRSYADWSVRSALQDSAGDGTVPFTSGRAPLKHALQQFELSDVEHEGVYRDSASARAIVHYAITKLAAKAELP